METEPSLSTLVFLLLIFLQTNRSLRTVFLGCNQLGPSGALALNRGLSENKVVKSTYTEIFSILPATAAVQ